MEACPFVSVIIPVFNDAERLKLCLDALANQSYGRSRYEVIVVDNSSDDQATVAALTASYDSVILTHESMPGSYAARNKGISLAKGKVIAFTDADCIPAPDWIEKGTQHLLKAPNCGLVAGEIRIFFKDPDRLTSVELFEKVTAFAQRQYVQEYRYGATANLFTLKHIIDHVGMFNPSLKSSGDKEWGQRVAASDYQQVYAADACVLHPARYSFKQLYGRTLRIIGGSYDLNHKREGPSHQRNGELIRALFEDLLPPLNFVVSTFRDSRLKGLSEKLRVSLVMFFVRYVSAWERLRLMLGGISIRE